jgi:glucose-1-phosphatase
MIKNIIFDLGGVIINIDYNLTIEAFRELGIPHFDQMFSKFQQDRVADNFEKGLITENDFRNHIREAAGINYDDETIDRAWNAMLLDFPPRRIDMLKQLKSDGYNLFLLSNTNSIHQRTLQHDFEVQFGTAFGNLFTHAYYSHDTGMRKPEKEIFGKVLTDYELQPSETLYIEDSKQHTDVAQTLGIDCVLMQTNGDTPAIVFERLANR